MPLYAASLLMATGDGCPELTGIIPYVYEKDK
jgi:hypothetical protein